MPCLSHGRGAAPGSGTSAGAPAVDAGTTVATSPVGGRSHGLGRPSAGLGLTDEPAAWPRSQGLGGAGRPARTGARGLGRRARVRRAGAPDMARVGAACVGRLTRHGLPAQTPAAQRRGWESRENDGSGSFVEIGVREKDARRRQRDLVGKDAVRNNGAETRTSAAAGEHTKHAGADLALACFRSELP